MRLQESIKLEKTLIAQDERPAVDLSAGNLMTSKSPAKHHGVSQEDIKKRQVLKQSQLKIAVIRPISPIRPHSKLSSKDLNLQQTENYSMPVSYTHLTLPTKRIV